MKTALTDDPNEAAALVRRGKLVAFPTETVFGLGADALNAEAVRGIFATKERPADNPLIVHLARANQIESVAARLPPAARRLAKRFMPGPLTLVTEKKERVPDNLNEKFVFRISSGEIADRLAERGPITATSANISGNDTSYSVEGINPELKDKAEYIIDRRELEESPTSSIAEIVDGEVVMHREGPINKSEIEKIL